MAKYCILSIYWGLVGGHAQLMQCVSKDDGTVGVVRAQTDSRTGCLTETGCLSSPSQPHLSSLLHSTGSVNCQKVREAVTE